MAGQKTVVRWLVAAAVVAALSGCASVPDAIKGTTPTPQQDLVRVMNAPQLYVGQEARFGGKVVSVQNQQGKTRLEIATVQLDGAARPELGEPSRGRIFADVNGFIDPVDFRGQLVTVVGPIVGVVDGKVGNTPYKLNDVVVFVSSKKQRLVRCFFVFSQIRKINSDALRNL